MEDQQEAYRYLGAGVSARLERCKGSAPDVDSFIVHLAREHSNREPERVEMEPLVLNDFLEWLCECGIHSDCGHRRKD